MLALLCICVLVRSCFALWPQPEHFDRGSSTLWLSPDVQLIHEFSPGSKSVFAWPWYGAQQIIGTSENTTSSNDREFATTLLQSAFDRMKYDIFNRSFVPQKFYPRDVQFEPALDVRRQYIQRIVIEEDSRHAKRTARRSDKSEAYELKISNDGAVLIKISSPRGGLYALQTFSQLFFAHSASSLGSYTSYAPLLIRDSPAFEHRGLNLDIARNWIPPKDVMRTIEAMAANKLNRLHLHAADSQAWPIEIPARPELASKGAYSKAQIWSVGDLEAVQLHGTEFGVDVFLEIDLPGHTASVGNAYPHLVTAKDVPWPDYALEPPSGQLRLNSSDVPLFIEDVLNDLLSRTSKHVSLFHLGGDEVNMNSYSLDPTVGSSSYETLRPLVQAFISHVISIATAHSLTVILWEEMVLDWKLDLPENVIIQTWRDSHDKALDLILDNGYRTLFGSNSHWYLDCGHGWFVDPEPSNPDSPVKPPYLDHCSPYKNWRQVYAYDPLAGVRQDKRHLVLGGEAHLWGELTDSVNLDFMLWPRLAAAAEVMWSGPGKQPSEDTTRRLAEMRERLVMRGIGAGVVQMEWCLRHKGGCTQ
ncbi:MAG: N-acetyl-glucosamine-6-phosphate deacetylase [Chrysothrix sp. TS-e1954]|nr:MAG: N-acetyl-glucosamine-6-phosphate deacetylase [Chrysothrix sp. TS-e1954]